MRRSVMEEFEEKSYEGRGGNLGAAFENAWNSAKTSGAPPGVYTVEIAIEVSNPIHSYIVLITPTG
jgi:hypothetical protein